MIPFLDMINLSLFTSSFANLSNLILYYYVQEFTSFVDVISPFTSLIIKLEISGSYQLINLLLKSYYNIEFDDGNPKKPV